MKNKFLMILLSLALSFALWSYVVLVVSPESEAVYESIPVVLDGAATLADRDLMIISDTNFRVDLKLSGNRQDLNKLQKQHDELQQQLAKYSGNNLAQLRKKFAQEFNAAETYQIKSAAGKKVLLLELARKKWQFSAAGKKLSFAPACAMQLVIEELKKFPPDKVHLVIAVRPSAGTFAEGAKSHLQQNFPAMEITAEPLMSENFGALTL